MKNYRACAGEPDEVERPLDSGMFVTSTGANLVVRDNPSGSCRYCYFYDNKKERSTCDDADFKQGPCSSKTRDDKRNVVFIDKKVLPEIDKELQAFGKTPEEKKRILASEGVGMKSFLAAALLAGAPMLDAEAAKAKKTAPTSVTANTSRGLRNNNPGNIISSSIKWQGKIGTDGRFVKFDTMENGVRALARILKVYQKKYGLNTIEGLIKRWAPPVENDTNKYIEFVSKNSDIAKDAKLNLNDPSQLYRVVDCIIRYENGKALDGKILAKGIKAEDKK